MKIKRYQSGGILYTPFFRDPVIPQSQPTSSENKEDQLIQKEIISVLKENGLQNDVDYFLSKANGLLKKDSLFGNDSSYDMSDLIRVISLANRTRRNFSDFNNAVEQVRSEGAGAEIAVTDRGALYVYDGNDKKVKTVSATSYYSDTERYTALTNSELLHLRESNPELAYNSSILTDLNSTIGMQSIVDHIKNVISAFGTNKEVQTHVSYTEKKHGQVQKGLEQMLSMGPDGIYEIQQKISSSHQGYENNEELTAALNYLYSTLNPKMKQVLAAHSVAEGIDPEKDNGKSLLLMAITEHTNHSIEVDPTVQYQSGMSKSSTGTTSSSSSMVTESWGNYIQKNQGMPVTASQVLKGGNIQLNLPAYHYGHIENESKGQVANATTGDETYNNLLSHGLVDTRRTSYFGDIPISNIGIVGQGILVDNTKGGMVTYVPVDNRGNINTELLKQMTEVQEKIINERITDPERKQKIWENYGFEYDPQKGIGKPVGYQLARYWVQSAYTSTGADVFDNKTLRSTMSLSKANDQIIEGLGLVYNSDPSHKNRPKIDISTGWFGKSYEGLLFIPMNNNQLETLVAEGTGYIPKPNNDITHAYQQTAYRSGVFNNGIPTTLNGTTSNELD